MKQLVTMVFTILLLGTYSVFVTGCEKSEKQKQEDAAKAFLSVPPRNAPNKSY
jgi:hypothetical protein